MVGNLAVKSVMNNSLYSGTTLQSGGGISTHSRRKLILPGDLIFFGKNKPRMRNIKCIFARHSIRLNVTTTMRSSDLGCGSFSFSKTKKDMAINFIVIAI